MSFEEAERMMNIALAEQNPLSYSDIIDAMGISPADEILYSRGKEWRRRNDRLYVEIKTKKDVEKIERQRLEDSVRKAALGIERSVLKGGLSLEDYPDHIKDSLREQGIRRIPVGRGKTKVLSRANRYELANYANDILLKVGVNPADYRNL